MCWEVEFRAKIVVIQGVQRYDGQEMRFVDYNIPDMLQMMGKASLPSENEEGKCFVYCPSPKKQFYKKFLQEPFPVESHLNHFIADHINAEIVNRTIENS